MANTEWEKVYQIKGLPVRFVWRGNPYNDLKATVEGGNRDYVAVARIVASSPISQAEAEKLAGEKWRQIKKTARNANAARNARFKVGDRVEYVGPISKFKGAKGVVDAAGGMQLAVKMDDGSTHVATEDKFVAANARFKTGETVTYYDTPWRVVAVHSVGMGRGRSDDTYDLKSEKTGVVVRDIPEDVIENSLPSAANSRAKNATGDQVIASQGKYKLVYNPMGEGYWFYIGSYGEGMTDVNGRVISGKDRKQDALAEFRRLVATANNSRSRNAVVRKALNATAKNGAMAALDSTEKSKIKSIASGMPCSFEDGGDSLSGVIKHSKRPFLSIDFDVSKSEIDGKTYYEWYVHAWNRTRKWERNGGQYKIEDAVSAAAQAMRGAKQMIEKWSGGIPLNADTRVLRETAVNGAGYVDASSVTIRPGDAVVFKAGYRLHSDDDEWLERNGDTVREVRGDEVKLGPSANDWAKIKDLMVWHNAARSRNADTPEGRRIIERAKARFATIKDIGELANTRDDFLREISRSSTIPKGKKDALEGEVISLEAAAKRKLGFNSTRSTNAVVAKAMNASRVARNVKSYPFYVVDKAMKGKCILSGRYELSDAYDDVAELKKSGVESKAVSRRVLIMSGIDPDEESSWKKNHKKD